MPCSVGAELVGQTGSLTRNTYEMEAAHASRLSLSRLIRDDAVSDSGFEPVNSSVSGHNLFSGVRQVWHLEPVQGRSCAPCRLAGRQFG
jgi:hypothetical protein